MSRAKFAAAKELIQSKQYAEARSLLETIDDPLAAEWIAKVDALSPRPLLLDEPPADQATVKTTITWSDAGIPNPATKQKEPVAAVKPVDTFKSLVRLLKRGIGRRVTGRKILAYSVRFVRARLAPAPSEDQIGFYSLETGSGHIRTPARRKAVLGRRFVSLVCLLVWVLLVSRFFVPAGTPTVSNAAPVQVFKADTSQQRRPTPAAAASLRPEDEFQLKFLEQLSNRIQSVRLIKNGQALYTVIIIYKTGATTSQEFVDEWMMIIRPLAQVILDQGLAVGEVFLLSVDQNDGQVGKFSTTGQDLLALDAKKMVRADFLKRAKFESYKPTSPLQPTSTR
jgi:hypothetical protein